MGLFELFWDMDQERRIRDAEDSTARNERRLQSARDSTEEMHGDFERLALVTQAVWELLRDRAGVTEADLLVKVEEVDLRDGTADGRARRKGPTCTRCKKVNGASRPRCLYCGAPLQPATAFEKL